MTSERNASRSRPLFGVRGCSVTVFFGSLLLLGVVSMQVRFTSHLMVHSLYLSYMHGELGILDPVVSSSSSTADAITSTSPLTITQVGGATSAAAAAAPATTLAQEQSLGFFDDISDSNWKHAQNIHAKLFPNHWLDDLMRHSNGIADKGVTSNLRASKNWNAENFQEEFHCAYAQRIPSDSNGDGPKWVCDPHRLSQKDDCLVYSFGSNGNVMFEKGIRDEIGSNCEIHTFDMVTSNKRNGVFSEALDGLSTFHPWGLGTAEQAKNPRSRMKTLAQTMEELGHTGRRIDIFKIDCEWCEWHTYSEWIQFDIRQVLVETHNAPMPLAKDFFYNLHDAGFVIFSKEANFQNGGGCVEFAFLKLSTSFFVNDTMYSKLGSKS